MTDVARRMAQFIDETIGDGPYSSPMVASQVVEKLRANDPGMLSEWLDAQAETFVWQAINNRDRSMRAHTRATSARGVFAKAADAAASGDTEALATSWLATPFTGYDNVRKPLAQFTPEDLGWAAREYETIAARSRMNAVFIRLLAKKVRTGTVADHFSEAQIDAMWSSLQK